jgi:hypothetical protein
MTGIERLKADYDAAEAVFDAAYRAYLAAHDAYLTALAAQEQEDKNV